MPLLYTYILSSLRHSPMGMVSCFTHEDKLTCVIELEILLYTNFALVSNCLNKEF